MKSQRLVADCQGIPARVDTIYASKEHPGAKADTFRSISGEDYSTSIIILVSVTMVPSALSGHRTTAASRNVTKALISTS